MDVVDGDIAALEQALAGPAEHWTGGAVEDESLHGIVADDLPYQRLARSEPLLCRDGQPLVDAPLGQRRLEAVELDEEGIIVGMHYNFPKAYDYTRVRLLSFWDALSFA